MAQSKLMGAGSLSTKIIINNKPERISMAEREGKMNNTRRKGIKKISEKVSDLRIQLEELLSEIEEVKGEEEEYRDNIPENMQSGERYEVAEAAVESLDSAYGILEDAISSLEEMENTLDEAVQ